MAAEKTYLFPDDPLITSLLSTARLNAGPDKFIYHSHDPGKSYPELLGDIARMCDALRDRLPSSALNERGTFRREPEYVAIFGRSSYEFIVAFFAIRAMGGTCMPLGGYSRNTKPEVC